MDKNSSLFKLSLPVAKPQGSHDEIRFSTGKCWAWNRGINGSDGSCGIEFCQALAEPHMNQLLVRFKRFTKTTEKHAKTVRCLHSSWESISPPGSADSKVKFNFCPTASEMDTSRRKIQRFRSPDGRWWIFEKIISNRINSWFLTKNFYGSVDHRRFTGFLGFHAPPRQQTYQTTIIKNLELFWEILEMQHRDCGNKAFVMWAFRRNRSPSLTGKGPKGNSGWCQCVA